MSTLMTFVWKSAVWWSTGKQHLCDIVCQSISSAFEIWYMLALSCSSAHKFKASCIYVLTSLFECRSQIKAEKLSFHIFGKKTIPGHSWQKLKTVSKKHCQRRSISFAAAASPHSKALQVLEFQFRVDVVVVLACFFFYFFHAFSSPSKSKGLRGIKFSVELSLN